MTLRAPSAINTPARDGGRTRPRLVLLTCVYQRPELTATVLSIYREMKNALAEDVELCLLAVGSEGESSRALCEDAGFDYLEYANSPLSYKWNAGVQAARAYDADGVIIMGSDDLVSQELFGIYASRLADGLDFFGLKDLYFYDASSGVLGYWSGYPQGDQTLHRQGEPIGCGRCFSRALLDATDWNLWPHGDPHESLLDNVALRFVRERGFTHETWTMAELGIRAVDVKVGPNITAFQSIPFLESWTGERAQSFLGEWLSAEQFDELSPVAQEVETS